MQGSAPGVTTKSPTIRSAGVLRKLADRLFGKKPDTLAVLHREPTLEEWSAERRIWQEADYWDALRDGAATISGYTNVAYGTRGFSLHWLVVEGYMRYETKPGLPGEGGRYCYSVTDKGRQKLSEMAAT